MVKFKFGALDFAFGPRPGENVATCLHASLIETKKEQILDEISNRI